MLSEEGELALVSPTPGVSPGPPNGLATGTRPDDRRLSSSYSVNGQDPVVNNNMIDGMDNNERVIGTIGVRPSIDAIQEFKVQTNLYSAEISRTSGGVVNILSKSGTNNCLAFILAWLRSGVAFLFVSDTVSNPARRADAAETFWRRARYIYG